MAANVVHQAALICNGEPEQKALMLDYLGVKRISWLVIHTDQRLPPDIEAEEQRRWEEEIARRLHNRRRRRRSYQPYWHGRRASKPLINITVVGSETAAWIVAQHLAVEESEDGSRLEQMEPQAAVEEFNRREWNQSLIIQSITLY